MDENRTISVCVVLCRYPYSLRSYLLSNCVRVRMVAVRVDLVCLVHSFKKVLSNWKKSHQKHTTDRQPIKINETK